MSQDFFTDINLSQEKALSYSLPDILIRSETQLIQFTYHSQTQKYESQAVTNLEETPSSESFWHFVVLSDSIFVGQKNIDQRLNRRLNQEQTDRLQPKIIKLSPSLEKLKVYECGNVAAMATDENHIFVCTEGKLVALNQDLETLDEVELKLQNWIRQREKKNAHNILIHQSIAYLLDNVVRPIYILRVDISNPNNLQILSTFEITGTNHHLKRQWINPDLNQWCILQSYSHQGGSGENIIIFPLNLGNGYVKVNTRPIVSKYSRILGYKSISSASFGSSQKSGFELTAVTSLPPLWGIIYEEREQLHLVKIETSNNQVNFEKKLYLGELKDYFLPKAWIMFIDNLVFLVIQGYTNQNSPFTRLLIIDVAQEPLIILNQNLEVQGVHNSNMLYLPKKVHLPTG